MNSKLLLFPSRVYLKKSFLRFFLALKSKKVSPSYVSYTFLNCFVSSSSSCYSSISNCSIEEKKGDTAKEEQKEERAVKQKENSETNFEQKVETKIKSERTHRISHDLNEISNTYFDLGYVTDKSKVVTLINALSESLKVQLLALPLNSYEISRSYLELALAEHRALDFTKALRHYTKALQIYRNLSKEENDFNVAKILSYIGVLYRDMGLLDKAEEHMLQSLKMKKALIGENHVCIADTLNNLGALLHIKGDFEQAANYYEDAIRVLLTASAGDSQSPFIALSYYNLGCCYGELGELENARTALIRGYRISTNVFGEESDTSKRIMEFLNVVTEEMKKKRPV